METFSLKPELDVVPTDLSELANYIINHHHEYLAKNLPILWDYTQKIAQKHAKQYPELVEIAAIIDHFVNDLPAHLAHEEKMVFPYIHKLSAVNKHKDFDDLPPFQFLHNPIDHVQSEHDEDLLALEKLKNLSQNFTAPTEACETHRLTFAKLAEFWADLRQHIYLEHEILFPKAFELEKKLWLV